MPEPVELNRCLSYHEQCESRMCAILCAPGLRCPGARFLLDSSSEKVYICGKFMVALESAHHEKAGFGGNGLFSRLPMSITAIYRTLVLSGVRAG